ncbi:MAG: four-helix bundle copper-binding protein [Acetobacteraceae bacterium]|nr:MAG: four-helix bundle copper-binding protein [Acetobacteraceae bacterium]
MLRTHPHQPSAMETIRACIEACFDCAQTCTNCADACLAEPHLPELVHCIRLNLDCADLCGATGRIAARLTKPSRAMTEAALQACLTACGACGDECRGHAGMHEHCRICAEACDACAKACRGLLDEMA